MVDDENNFDEARDALNGGLREGLVELHTETLRTLDSNMRAGKDALGREWAPIKPESLRSRQVRTDDARPLVDTGDLRADIMSTSEVNVQELYAIIGSSLDYAEVHELGAPEAGIPRRPIFAPAAKYAERRAPDILGAEIDTRLEGATID